MVNLYFWVDVIKIMCVYHYILVMQHVPKIAYCFVFHEDIATHEL
jgi:hypothetical protein